MSIPNLLGGKLLTGVLPASRQPPGQPLLPAYDGDLFDIEACIDNPILAPLGDHVRGRALNRSSQDIGQVEIKYHQNNDMSKDGLVMFRRRGWDAEQLSEQLELLLPLAPFLKPATRYQSLVELDISRNKLSRLPPVISELRHLKTVNVSRNMLSTIPTELYPLEQLETLVLNENKITSIPDEMPIRLPRLVTLRIAGNAISHISPHISHWTQMRHLQLGSVFGGNRLQSLPQEMGDLESLVELDLSNNQLQFLPPLRLPDLTHLNVSHNLLEHLPVSIADCLSLRTINVSKNHLTTLPADLAELEHLELLDVSNNLLCIIPADIVERTTTTLLISGNPLARPGHCFTPVQDDYSRILQRMVLWARPTHSGTVDWSPRVTSISPSSDLWQGPLPSPPWSPTNSASSVMTNHTDHDASVDRELALLARRLNVSGSRPCTPGSLAGTRDDEIEKYEENEEWICLAADIKPTPILFPSLHEIAARTLVLHYRQWPPCRLPLHIQIELTRRKRRCTFCQRPYVNEWVTSIQVKESHGHPAIVRRVRYCSTQCWENSTLEMEPEETMVCVHRVNGPMLQSTG